MYTEEQKRAFAARWLGFAEADVARGDTDSNAIKKYESLCLPFPELQERVEALKEKLEENKAQCSKFYRDSAYSGAHVGSFQERSYGKWIVITKLGRPFPVDEALRNPWEGKWFRNIYYRNATPEECAEHTAKKNALARAHREIELLEKAICTLGERPENSDSVVGDTYFNTFNIYGSGDKFVVTEDKTHIWFIINHSMDGDTWEGNNLPGAIGFRIPYTPEFEAKLKELHTLLGGCR